MKLYELLKIIDPDMEIVLLTKNPINHGDCLRYFNKDDIPIKLADVEVEKLFISIDSKDLCIEINYRDWEY